MESLKKSVSDGKSAIASAITENGVSTESDATFETMANNILQLYGTFEDFTSIVISASKSISSGDTRSLSGSYTCKSSGSIDVYFENTHCGSCQKSLKINSVTKYSNSSGSSITVSYDVKKGDVIEAYIQGKNGGSNPKTIYLTATFHGKVKYAD